MLIFPRCRPLTPTYTHENPLLFFNILDDLIPFFFDDSMIQRTGSCGLFFLFYSYSPIFFFKRHMVFPRQIIVISNIIFLSCRVNDNLSSYDFPH